MEGPEEILLDLNALAAGHKYLGLGAFAVSDDGHWLAYSTDTTGYRQYNLHVKDLRTGKVLAENIERVGSVVWATDNRTLFYTTEDAVSKRSDKFWRHAVGAAGSDLLYEEKSELFDVAASRSLDKKVIFLASYAKTSTEVRYLPADTPAAAAKVILPREAGHEYDVDHYNGLFYITTNKGAKNFKVVTAPMNDPAEKNWRVFIEHNPAVRISGLAFFANHIVVSEREGGLTELRVIDPKTRQSHRIATDEPDFALSLDANPEFETYDASHQLSVDGDAAFGVRLRPLDPRSASCSSGRKCSAATIPRATRPGACGRSPATGRRCRSRSCTRRASRSMARRRCCCMATARTERRERPRSPRVA